MLLSLLLILFPRAIDFLLPVIQPSVFFSNNSSAVRHPDFVVREISELLDNDSILQHSEHPFYVNPLTVA